MDHKQSSRRTLLQCERLEDRLVPDATSYVKSLYVNLLNRTADTGGLNHFVSEIQSGVSNQQVALEIWRSPEHRGIQVDSFYQLFLGRAADATGRAFWVNQLLSGTLSELGVAANFLTSAEYLATHNTPTAYITGLYLDILGREASASEQAFWQNALLNFGDAAVTAGILTSGEAYTDIITNDYVKYLNRTPDANGLGHFLSQLDTGVGTVESVAESILGSTEYANTH
jgi:hypothetical protein